MKTLLNPLRIALLVCLAIVVATGFVLVPAGRMLPVHWGLSGTADAFLPRELALLMPVLIAAIAWASSCCCRAWPRPPISMPDGTRSAWC